ncbi:unnamed protein product [Peronospora belbahrii]|uniref:Uncharacterized protein n=1 Tax=Peronospora belbahrii TaxID=622444 RepID=A0ABN8CX01_9STRA|nr:unnamed protein product [Peronospora belbahrii]
MFKAMQITLRWDSMSIAFVERGRHVSEMVVIGLGVNMRLFTIAEGAEEQELDVEVVLGKQPRWSAEPDAMSPPQMLTTRVSQLESGMQNVCAMVNNMKLVLSVAEGKGSGVADSLTAKGDTKGVFDGKRASSDAAQAATAGMRKNLEEVPVHGEASAKALEQLRQKLEEVVCEHEQQLQRVQDEYKQQIKVWETVIQAELTEARFKIDFLAAELTRSQASMYELQQRIQELEDLVTNQIKKKKSLE